MEVLRFQIRMCVRAKRSWLRYCANLQHSGLHTNNSFIKHVFVGDETRIGKELC